MPTPNLTDPEMLLVKTELSTDPLRKGYAAMSAAAKAMSLVSRGMVTNPVAVVRVPKTMNRDAILGMLTSASRITVDPLLVVEMTRAIDEQDVEAVKRWAAIALTKSQVSTADHNAIRDEAIKTINDPNYRATMPGINRLTTVLRRPAMGLSADEIIAAEAA